jgi:hypothetical protein
MTVIIKTSSWFTKLPHQHVRIGISRGMPTQLGTYMNYRPLAPGPWFRSCETPEEYRRLYFGEVLAELDPKTVVGDLALMADGEIPVLLSWAAPPPDEKWCHRGLVSAWLFDALGLQVCEVGHERLGFGWQHPKLHPTLVKGT